MNLVVDIGNSSTKVALFSGKEKIKVIRSGNESYGDLKNNLSAYKIEKAIISSVREIPEDIKDLISAGIPFVHIVSHQTKLPFKNLYETPESLGTDRIAAAAGAFSIFPAANMLVIDAGTAVTYEFLSANAYKGGNISPGLSMRFEALHRFTGKLPLVTPSEKYSFPALNTTDAIAAGVITGMIYEINEYIRTFEKNHTDAMIIITGGDGEFFKDKLYKQLIYMPDLVMEGLNFILEYNAK